MERGEKKFASSTIFHEWNSLEQSSGWNVKNVKGTMPLEYNFKAKGVPSSEINFDTIQHLNVPLGRVWKNEKTLKAARNNLLAFYRANMLKISWGSYSVSITWLICIVTYKNAHSMKDKLLVISCNIFLSIFADILSII